MKQIKVGVIGLGSFAHAARLPVLASLDNVELTACMVRTQATVDRIARQFGFQKRYTVLEDLIENSGIDAAFVITPKQTHYEIVMPLLERGIHVFCEKPMAMSLKEAKEMVDQAEKVGRLLMIGFNRRYAAKWETTAFNPGPISQIEGPARRDWLRSHMATDSRDAMKIYADRLKTEADR